MPICPVCETEFIEGEVNENCPICHWDLTPDSRTIGPVPEAFQQKLQRTLKWARNSWTERQELQSQLAQMQAQISQAERDKSVLQVQLEKSLLLQTVNSEKAKVFSEALGDGIYLEMVLIPGGTFLMGSPETEAEQNEKQN